MMTLKQLKNGLRTKLGELSDGTWGSYKYGDSTDVVDEHKDALNQSQVNVGRDIFDPETYPLTKTSVDLPINTGATFYSLPADFLAMERVTHKVGNRNRPVLPGSIKNVASDAANYTGPYYRHYEVRGRMNTYVATGTVQTASDNQINDSNGNFSSVRVGDYVYNLTDSSEARVVEFQSGQVVFDQLEGGMRNTFDVGDSYAIGTSEAIRKMLLVDPPVTNSNTIIYDGRSDSISGQAGVVQEVYVSHTSLPSDWTDQSTANYKIFKDNKLVKEWGQVGIRIGTQQIGFEPFQVQEGVVYHITCTDETGATIDISNVRLELLSRDRLVISYARRPRTLTRDDSVCEFDVEFREAILQGAANILIEKVADNNVTPRLLLDKYEYEIAKVKDFLNSLGESGSYELGIDAYGQPIDYINQGQSGEYDWTTEVYLI